MRFVITLFISFNQSLSWGAYYPSRSIAKEETKGRSLMEISKGIDVDLILKDLEILDPNKALKFTEDPNSNNYMPEVDDRGRVLIRTSDPND